MNQVGQTNNSTTLTEQVAQIRKMRCRDCACNVDFFDPCAECPQKKWKKFDCDNDTEQPVTESSFPSASQMAANFASASIDELKAIFKNKEPVSAELKQERMDICRSCEMFDPTFKRCKHCGCFLDMKTAWRSQKCPIGKW